MAEKKLVNTKFVTVVVTNRNPETETVSGFVGGNNVVIDGKPTIKHYRFQLGEEISIPENFVAQLKNRSQVAKDKKGNRINVPLYLVEKA